METGRKIKQITVESLQGVFNYVVTFPEGEDTIILIAPNGYGKTALLSLLKDCVTLNFRRAAGHIFKRLEISFQDGTKWEFVKHIDEDRLRYATHRRAHRTSSWSASSYARFRDSTQSVSLKRFNKSGKEIEENIPDIKEINPRAISRVLNRIPYLSVESPSIVRHLQTGEIIPMSEAIKRYYKTISSDPKLREMLAASEPSAIWPGIPEIDCVFIETQRLLYSNPAHQEDDRGTPKEEIVRQAQSLSELLNKNYSDYAAISQTLDRSFPNRLIARARKGIEINADELKKSLSDVEEKRAQLTEAGILEDQADTIIGTDDDLLPKIVDALQIYVEDSKKKLGTYDAIYPKISVFRELMSAKLKPKTLSIGREFGAIVYRDKNPLKLEGLSSGEKHEFIMLFKLIFETPSDSLVLIDEPEISLHVVWQLEFMSDLRRIQSANPFQSIIATHSPQIFQGFKNLLVDLADQRQ